MIIKGIQKTSLVDFPPYIACTVFLPDCNFRCSYCYNTDLVLNHDNLPTIEESDFFSLLDKRKKWIDAVCVTGGEPLLHKDLGGFLKRIKEKEFKVKLDTNGTNPGMLKKLIDRKIVDYVAMDVKAHPDKYDMVCGVKVNKGDIRKSVSLLKKGLVDYEFRTTVCSRMLTKNDYALLGDFLRGARKLFIQQFRGDLGTIDPGFGDMKGCTIAELMEIKRILGNYVRNVEVRGI